MLCKSIEFFPLLFPPVLVPSATLTANPPSPIGLKATSIFVSVPFGLNEYIGLEVLIPVLSLASVKIVSPPLAKLVHDKTPDPSVFNTWLAVPYVEGKVNTRLVNNTSADLNATKFTDVNNPLFVGSLNFS